MITRKNWYLIQKMADPKPHEEYLHHMGASELYRKELAKALKTKITDKEKLIDHVMAQAKKGVEKHFGGSDERFYLTREDLADLIERLESQIKKEGGVDEETAGAIAANYQSRARQVAITKYSTHLRMLPMDQAQESAQELANFTGNEQHAPHIKKTKKWDTLVNRVQNEYHPDVGTKTTEMVREGQAKPGKSGFLVYEAGGK